MKNASIPYSIQELDTILNKCIAFEDAYKESFSVVNIGGVESVDTGFSSALNQKLYWLVELDNGLMVAKGFDAHHVFRYQVGAQARRVMNAGGLEYYFKKQKRQGILQRMLKWSAVVVVLLVLMMAIITWATPLFAGLKY